MAAKPGSTMPSLPHGRRSGMASKHPFAAAPRELSFLRLKGGAAAPARPTCAACGRTPLVGERLHVYAARDGERHVCELCRARQEGAPVRTEIVHSPEHHRAVKARTRAA